MNFGHKYHNGHSGQSDSCLATSYQNGHRSTQCSTTSKPAKASQRQESAGIGIVFAIAVYGSAVHVASHYGQPAELAIPLPAMIDIFALFCAIKLRSCATAKIQRILNRAGMWSMLTLSMWFNIESALITNVTLMGIPLVKAVIISAIPAGVVALAAEILTHTRKSPSHQASPKATFKAPSKAAGALKASIPTQGRVRKSIKSEKPTEPITETV